MKRCALTCLLVASMLGLGLGPARSTSADWAGAGPVVGSLVYDHLPAAGKTCKPTTFVLALDAPAFVLRTPDGLQTVPLSIRGGGAGHCDSEASATAGFVVELRAGELRCDLRAAYTRIGSAMHMGAGEPSCEYADGRAAPGYGWLFDLVYERGRLSGTATYAP